MLPHAVNFAQDYKGGASARARALKANGCRGDSFFTAVPSMRVDGSHGVQLFI